jgi:hypothetical protein
VDLPVDLLLDAILAINSARKDLASANALKNENQDVDRDQRLQIFEELPLVTSNVPKLPESGR